MFAHILKLLLLVLCIAACSTAPPKGPIRPVTTGVEQSAKEYKISKGDMLDVKFFYNPELNEQVTVRPDGRITLQLAKEIQAEGLTPAQLTEVLTSHYAAQINHPEIAVILRTFAGQRVFVDGEVMKAGMVVLTDPMTILQAVSQAGGLKETADLKNVLLIRRTADDKVLRSRVNLNKAMAGNGADSDVLLMPNDIVLVPRTGIANLDIWVDQYIRKLIPFPIGVGLGLGY